MVLLPLLAMAAGLALQCRASLLPLPGTPPPEIEERQDLPTPGPWEKKRHQTPPMPSGPWDEKHHQTPPPMPSGPWDKDFELNNPSKTSQGEELFESDILLSEKQWEEFRERKAINYEGSRWPEGSDEYPLVPYVYYDSEVNGEAVKAGIDHWMEHTCIKFEETTNTDQTHLQFVKSSGCWSYVGMTSSTGQQISIGAGCTSLGVVAHEIGHAMGFYHEQSRSDRDEHVAIKYDNIKEDKKHNFNKRDTNNFDVKYDYGSDMHYGSFYFHNNGKMTIVTIDPFAQELIASRAGLSHRDKLLANKMYKCLEKWMSKCGVTTDPCQNEGYLGAECTCICPPGTSGENCETVTSDYYAHLRSEHTEAITTEKTISHIGNAKFTKKIVAPTCKLVKLTFTSFNLYKKITSSSGITYCYYEYIFLRTGQDLTEGEIYCAQDITAGQSFTSETDTMVLFAEAKYSDISDGWTAKVEFVKDPGCDSNTNSPATATTITAATTTTPPVVEVIECISKPKTKKIKAGEAILIQSPDYPNKYPAKKCGWKLKGDGTEKVKVSCSNFAMEEPKEGKCIDFLKIGTETFCGKNGPVDVTVNVKKLTKLMFKSNAKKSRSGFSCTVTAFSDDLVATAKPTTKPSNCKCGQKKADARIINGKETAVLEYPWQAGLVSAGGTRTWCGGSLINSNWVLTAAHCTVGSSATNIQVLLAEHDVTVSESHTERFSVKQIINHPSYDTNPWTNGHDVSLLELDGRVNFETSQARPICLPEGNSDYAGALVTLTGFGRIGHNQSQSNYLREVDIHVISNAECSQVYGGSESNYDTMICAGEDDGTGGCMGDSGGPLIIKKNNHYEQVGVVSYGSSLCNSYGVFARVTDLNDWIVGYTNTGNPDTCSP